MEDDLKKFKMQDDLLFFENEDDLKSKQAGLSRATLNFSSGSSAEVPIRTHQLGRLPLEVILI